MGDKNGERKVGKAVAALHVRGSVQDAGGEQADRLAVKWMACSERADEWRELRWGGAELLFTRISPFWAWSVECNRQ